MKDQRNSLNVNKKVFDISHPKLIKIDGRFYWVSGEENVFLLNHNRFHPDEHFARKLLSAEIESLPVTLVYTGVSKHYKTDDKAMFEKILEIIDLMNGMQEKKFWSFPLGTTNFPFRISKVREANQRYTQFHTTKRMGGNGDSACLDY